MDVEVFTFFNFALNIRDNSKLLVVLGTLDTVVWNLFMNMSVF